MPDAPPIDAIRAAVRAVARGAAADLSTTGDPRADGPLTLSAFVLGARATIKAAHLAATAAAAGGFRNLTPADAGRLGGKLKGLYGALTDLEFQYRSDQISAAMLAARVASLVRGAMGTFENAVRDRAKAAGAKYAKRELGFVEQHCAECLDLAGLGFLPIDEVRPIGDCLCGGNCACSLTFSYTDQ